MAKTKFESFTAHLSSSSNQKSLSSLAASSNNISQVTNDQTEGFIRNLNNSEAGVKPYVKRLSHSIEKNVSKLLTNQDCNIINGDTDMNTEILMVTQLPTPLSEIKSEEKNSEETNLNKESSTEESKSNDSHVFIEKAIKELLKARRILRWSYVYGYYLDTFGHKKFIFEFIQTEFEESTENLSQIIARPHLKTPKLKIIRLTNILRKKRIEFIDTIVRGLNSFNDTPPTLKKYSRQRWKYLLKDNIQNDDEFKNTIALSLKELNPKNPWIIDKKGRHTNLLALLNDWPELEQELDSILVPSKDKSGLCARKDCGNVRAVNTLSGSVCNYCSIKCMRSDRTSYLERRSSSRKSKKQKESKRSEAKNTLDTSNTKLLQFSTHKVNELRDDWSKLKSNASSLDSNVDLSNRKSIDSICLMNKSSDGQGSMVKSIEYANDHESAK